MNRERIALVFCLVIMSALVIWPALGVLR